MDDEMLELTNRSDVEVVRRLEAYSDLRLTPSLAARTRVRAAVMQATRQHAATIAADVAADRARAATAPLAIVPARGWAPIWRRPFAALAAATLTVGLLAGSALASSAGGPLYGARMWTELALLPAAGTARAQGEAHRLEVRLQEVQQASAAGDEPATEAALTAYSAILSEATSATADDPAAATTLETAVTRHVAVLTALADRVASPARAAIESVLAASTVALQDLHTTGRSDGGTGAGGAGGSGHGGSAGGRGGATAPGRDDNPGRPTDPVGGKPTDAGGGRPTDKPGKDPGATNKPTRTDRPAPTPAGGHGGNGPAVTPPTGPGGGNSGQHAPSP